MKLNLLILLSFAFLIGCSQIVGNIGGYQPYTTLNSSQFQAVEAFIYAEHSEIKDYAPTSVSRQLVNGFNYNVTLTSPEGCQVVAIVYTPFQGPPSISSYTVNPCAAKTVEPPTIPIIIQRPILTGAYRVLSNPSGEDFSNALAKALAKNPQYTKGDLVLTETQTVNGFNYRFTFRKADGSLYQTVIYIPIFANSDPEGEQVVVSAPIYGGYSELTSPSDYQEALNAVYSQKPELKNYRLSYAAEQVVAGRNYKFSFSSNSDTRIKYASYLVFVNLDGKSTVTQISWIDVGNYSVPQLNQALASTISLHPEVKGLTLQSIVNIWQNGEGLNFSFNSASKKYQVYIYQLKGTTRNLIY